MRIHDFAKLGDLAGVSAELAAGVPVDLVEQDGYTPLHYVLVWHASNIELVSLLIDYGADPNLVQGGESPVSSAIKRGSLAVVEKLIDAGADVLYEREYGYNALTDATISSDSPDLVPIVELLVSKGVRLDATTNFCEIRSQSRIPERPFRRYSSLVESGSRSEPAPVDSAHARDCSRNTI